jgi:hypothetical protein
MAKAKLIVSGKFKLSVSFAVFVPGTGSLVFVENTEFPVNAQHEVDSSRHTVRGAGEPKQKSAIGQ